MIIEQQDCTVGKSVYVKHPVLRADVSKAVKLSDDQLLILKEYLLTCCTNQVRPDDSAMIEILNMRGAPLVFQ